MKKKLVWGLTIIFLIALVPIILSLTTTQLFFDGFEAADFATVWTSDAAYQRQSAASNTDGGGTNSIEVDGNVNNVIMEVTLSKNITSYTYCNLTSRILIESGFDGNEYVCMDYSTNNGTTWNRDAGSDGGVGGLCQDGNVDTEGAFRTVVHYIASPTGIENFRYRFRTTVNKKNEDAYIDNVNLTCTTNAVPTISNITVSDSIIKGGNTITFYANTSNHGVNDTELDTLNFYCSTETSPTAINTNCTGGTTSDSTYPYALTCTFATPVTDTIYNEYCRLNDGSSYSSAVNITYTTDSTPPSTSISSVAGDTVASYFDTINDGVTEINISGEASMSCRWSTSDVVYSSMSNDCVVGGNTANCSITGIASQGFYTRYVSCQDQYTNEQSTIQNLDVGFYLDYTAPTTTDNSTATVHVPDYIVNISEADNVDADPLTLYCTDTTNTCNPSLSIDHGGQITFTSANRGVNYLRYNSTDDAGNNQSIQSSTININRLPLFLVAGDDATIVKGGTTISVATNSSDLDAGQEITLYVCNSSLASPSGCTNGHYCNTTGTANLSCSFTSETDSTTHNWYAFIYDELEEASVNNSLGGSYTTDSTPPSITIDNPTNGSTIAQNSVTFTITSDEALTNAWYSLNDGVDNVTMANTTLLSYTQTNTSIADGVYNATFWANDTYGTIGTSGVISFTIDTTPVDTTPPAITINSPANTSYQNPSNTIINITADEALNWAGYQLNGGSVIGLGNVSTTNWNITLTSLSQETTYNLTIYANDTSNNENNKTIIFYADSLSPSYTSAQANPSPANVSQNVNCSITWTDTYNITSIKIGENSTGTQENHTISFSGVSGSVSYLIPGVQLDDPGTYNCRFYATDAAGNFNSTSLNFNVNDVTSPTITVISPTNSSYNQANISISITLSENASSAWYSLNGAANVTMDNTSSIAWNSTLTSLANGNYNIIFYANDTSSNVGNSSIVHFNINVAAADTVPPVITIDTLSNGTYYVATTKELNITADENTTWAGYILNSGSLTSMSNSSTTKWNATLSGLGIESTNNLEVYANDTVSPPNKGNKNITFYVDTLAPRFSSVTVSPNPANVSQNVICNAYVNDTFGITNVKIEENSSGTFTNHTISLTSAGWMNYTINSVSKGGYTCRFHATDAAGNYNTTSTSFTVNDVTAPTISINSPLNQTYSNANILFSITLNENATSANYSLDAGVTNVSLSGSETSWSDIVGVGADGSKTLIFYAIDSSGNVGNTSVTFYLDTSIPDTTPPTITIWAPTNGTYYPGSSRLLNISADEALNWAGYSNNSAPLVTLNNYSTTNWNATINLPEGQNNLTFYANDTSNNQASETITLWVDITNPQVSLFSCTDVNDSQDVVCNATITDVIGLSHAFIRHNATGSWQNSSNISLSGTSDTLSYTIASGNTTPKNFQSQLYLYDLSGRSNTTESDEVAIADDTFPKIHNITYYPNTSDDLDPNTVININVTIIEDFSISSVVLMYTNSSSPTWTSVIMTNNSAQVNGSASTVIYNASFTPKNETWTFKINATDYAGNQNLSSNYTLVVTNDTSQNISTSIPDIKSFTTAQATINNSFGTIYMNNTGDGGMDFNVTLTSVNLGTRLSVNYTGNQSYNYTSVSSNQARNITIDVNTTSLSAGLYPYNITIISRAGTTTYEKNLNIQSVLEPYLDVSIDTYSSTVTKGQTGLELVASVINSGTLEATDVYLNWTLPSGFTLVSGSISRSLGNLGIGIIGTNTITVDVLTSAADANVNLTANATSSNTESASDKKAVTIGSPTTVAGPVTPSEGGGSGGGGGGGAVEFYSRTIEIVRGQEDSFEIEVHNKYSNSTLDNLTLDITGYLAQYITISPRVINGLDFEETKSFTVTLFIPSYEEDYEEHTLKAVIDGIRVRGAETISYRETQNILLIIHEISEQESRQSFDEAEKAIEEMRMNDFNTAEVERLLTQAKERLEEGRNREAQLLSEKIISTKEKAFTIENLIRRIIEVEQNPRKASLLVGKNIKDFKSENNELSLTQLITGDATFGTSALKEILNLAIAAFERGDYDLAEERARSAQSMLLLERKGNMGLFFYLNWHYLLFSFVLISAVGVLGYRRYKKSSLTKRIEGLNKEEQNISKLRLETQRNYFLKKISVGEYNGSMDQHQKKIANLRKMRLTLRNRRIKMLKPEQILQNLESEKMSVESEIKKIQTLYYVDKKISEKDYKLQFESLNERLAEIEGERTTLNLLEQKSGKKVQIPQIKKSDLKRLKKKIEKGERLKAIWLNLWGLIKNPFRRRREEIVKKKIKKLRKKQIKLQNNIKSKKTIKDIGKKVGNFITKIYEKVFKKEDKKGIVLMDSKIMDLLKNHASKRDCKGKYIKINYKKRKHFK